MMYLDFSEKKNCLKWTPQNLPLLISCFSSAWRGFGYLHLPPFPCMRFILKKLMNTQLSWRFIDNYFTKKLNDFRLLYCLFSSFLNVILIPCNQKKKKKSLLLLKKSLSKGKKLCILCKKEKSQRPVLL